MPFLESDIEIRDVLQTCRKIAVIGLSPVPARPSYGVTRYMIQHGYQIFGVRPASPPKILDRPCVEKLSLLADDVDMFDVFRNPEALPQVMQEIEEWINRHPRPNGPARVLWLQEGVSHPEAEAHASRLGLRIVSDRCILKEHARLM